MRIMLFVVVCGFSIPFLTYVVAALEIKSKQQHGKNQNKNTGFFISCMDFVVVPLCVPK
jgi:hypothetical protein